MVESADLLEILWDDAELLLDDGVHEPVKSARRRRRRGRRHGLEVARVAVPAPEGRHRRDRRRPGGGARVPRQLVLEEVVEVLHCSSNNNQCHYYSIIYAARPKSNTGR